jgi:hypothetical protein
MNKSSLLLAILFVCRAGSSPAPSVNLPVDHWAYAFLERMEIRGILTGVRDGGRPFSRERMAGCARSIQAKLDGDPALLSGVERAVFEKLKGELWDELRETAVPVRPEEREPHLYSWSGDGGRFHADALLGGTVRVRTPDAPPAERRTCRPYYGAAFRGALWNVGFFSDNRVFAEWGSGTYLQNYDPSLGYPRNAEKDSSRATWDVSDAYLTWNLKGFRFEFGRDNARWGPSGADGLMFSGLAPSMDLFRMDFDIGRTRFTWLHGALRSAFDPKWISARRIECTVCRGVDLALEDAVIYGRRGVQAAYANPVLPFLVSQHSLGDRDNVTMGFDADVNRIRNVKLYGELFLDDLFAPWDLFADYWGDKTAVRAGAVWACRPLGIDAPLRIEYARVDPFVYTHADSANVFEHFASGLGSDLQPNSDRIRVSCEPWFSAAWRAGVRFDAVRHGRGDRRTAHRPEDGDRKGFLEGTVESTRRLGAWAEWEPRRDWVLRAEAEGVRTGNAGLRRGSSPSWIEWSLQASWNW